MRVSKREEVGDEIRKAGGPHHVGLSKLLLHGLYLSSTIIHCFFNLWA